MDFIVTEKQAQYIAVQLESGGYTNASEVIRDALRIHKVYKAKLLEDIKDEVETASQET